MLHVPVEELHVLLLLDEPARDVELVLRGRQEARLEGLAERLHVVVAAHDGVLLEPLELVSALAERVDLLEHGHAG